MTLAVYIHGLTGRVYKVLPLREAELEGAEVYLSDYLTSLTSEMRGSLDLFPELAESADYMSVINTLHYFAKHEPAHKECRREVFRMLKVLNAIEAKVGDRDV